MRHNHKTKVGQPRGDLETNDIVILWGVEGEGSTKMSGTDRRPNIRIESEQFK